MKTNIKFNLLICFNVLIITTFLSCGSIRSNEYKSPGENDFIKISPKDSNYFSTEDGTTWIPIMIDYIVPAGQEEEKALKTIESYFKNFSENGGNSMRIWISSPFLEIEDSKAGEYNPQKFHRIDELLKFAEQYQIKVKFTLQHIRTISAKESWSNSTILSLDNNGPLKDILEYVATPEGKKYYLKRAKALSNKYKDNKQIFGWELWNEMDALSGIKDEIWFSFSSEILDSIKALFPNHLVTQTLGSLHSEDANMRYEKLFTLNNNEFVSVHRYLDPGQDWNQYDEVTMPIDLLVHSAVDFAQTYVKDRPIVINEIGAVEGNHAGPSKLYAIDTAGVLIHDMIFAPFFSGAAGTGGLWHWNDYIQRQNLWYHFNRFKMAIEGIDPAEEGFRPFTFNVDGVRNYGLKGKGKTMIWCRDSENNWMTELEEKIPAKPRKNFSIQLSDLEENDFSDAKVYDPWSDKWTDIKLENETITLPSFTRSVVVVLY